MNSDLFSIWNVKTKTTIYGLPDKLRPGVLPQIEEAMNAQEVFDSSSRIARRFMRLEGENWDLEFDTRSTTIWSTGFLDVRQIEKGVSFFLGQVRGCVNCSFWAGEVTVGARWPLEPNPQRKKNAGTLLYEKSSRIKPEQLQLLPTGGIVGAGISLLGVLDDETGMWSLEAGPVGDELYLTLEMTYFEPSRSEWPDDELEVIESNIGRAYSIMDNEIKAFIDAVMP